MKRAAAIRNSPGILSQGIRLIGEPRATGPSTKVNETTNAPIIKKYPHEFLVSESLVLPMESTEGSRYSYLKLTKSGFTTFEALQKIAHYFRLSAEEVLFAGLKDEDAITEQFIAIEGSVSQRLLRLFNREHRLSPRGFMELRHSGAGNEPLRIGQLHGNSFRIVVRNLSQQFVEQFRGSNRHTLFFLNYYDAQRFGIAGRPKVNHLIGKALVDGDEDKAFELLKKAGTPEAQDALSSDRTPAEFFATVSPRIVNFFKDSYSSYLWNTRLAGLVKEVCRNETFEERCEPISFLLTRRQSLLLSLLKECRSMEFRKLYPSNASAKREHKLRSTVIQTQILFNTIGVDEEYHNAYKCEFSFFLPSGSYATMCIRQVVRMIDVGAG